MAFRGDLANVNLASVLQNLLHNEQTGTLRLFDDEDQAFIYFAAGHISMFSSGPEGRTPVGEYLSRAGDVTAKQMAAARKRLRGRRNLSAVLGRMGVEQDRIREAVRRFVEEEVCDLFTWESGRFEFTEGPAPAGLFDSDMVAAELKIDCNGLILEAARRADAWDQINRQIRSQNEIFVLRKEAAADLEGKFEPQVVEVARLLDGRRDPAMLAEESGLGRFPVLSALSQLIAGGAARPISLTEVIRLAEVALGGRDFEEAVRLHRRALEIERNNLECRRGLIEALEGAGDKTEAGAERKLLAATLLDMGRLEEAADELRRAVEDAPTDINAREKHIEVLRQTGSARQAEEARLELGRTYLRLGIAEKARKVFGEVLRERPGEPARVAMMLADACVKAGDVPAAVDAYRRAASTRIAAEQYDAAAEPCEEILKLQPDNAEARKRLEDIKRGRLLARKRRWRVFRYLAVLAALLALGAEWLVYDWFSRDFLDEMSVEAEAGAERGDAEGALGCYDLVSERYPWTRSASSARKLRAALAERTAMRLLLRGRELERSGLADPALALYRRAEALRPSGAVLRLLGAARGRVEQAPAPPAGVPGVPGAPGGPAAAEG